MRPLGYLGRSLLSTSLLFILVIRIAPAYIEPGYGGFLLKILVASLAGMVLAWRRLRTTIKLLFSKLFSRTHKQDE